MKKFLFTRKFQLGWKRVDFHSEMKFNLKENPQLSMKTYDKTYHFNFVHHFRLLIFLLRHFQKWSYEIEQNKNYSTNLTTIKYGLN